MIYLASPYSHDDANVREARYEAACRAVASLLRSGCFAYSPIVHSHPLAAYGLPTDWKFWESIDRRHLSHCDELAVLTLDGWTTSVGVQAEIRIAHEYGKPVRYVAPEHATCEIAKTEDAT
ncbi:MAG: DUF1937 family protein [Pirellulales bacterium]